jgi:hypothetical protein
MGPRNKIKEGKELPKPKKAFLCHQQSSSIKRILKARTALGRIDPPNQKQQHLYSSSKKKDGGLRFVQDYRGFK